MLVAGNAVAEGAAAKWKLKKLHGDALNHSAALRRTPLE